MRTELVFLVLAALAGCSAAYNATLYQTQDAIEDQYIVVLLPDYDASELVKKISSDTSGVFSGSSIKFTYTKALNGFSAKLTPNALEKVRAMKAVKYVSQDGVVRAQAVASWGLDRIDQRNLPLDGTSDFEGDGTGVNIYVVDSGIYPDSMYFNGRAEVAFDAIPRQGAYGLDCNGHGTHCAGTAGADTYGVARGAKLFGVRVLDCVGSGRWSYLVAGCDYIVNSGVKPAVVSMSLGGGGNTAADDAVQSLITAGFPVVAAAGNDNGDACYSTPARVPDVITVGATDKNDERASFSNYGSCVDLFGPGVDIPSAWINGPEDTRTISGTSMACPHVTGAAAIALGKSPAMSPTEVTNKIISDATFNTVTNPGNGSPNWMLYIPSCS